MRRTDVALPDESKFTGLSPVNVWIPRDSLQTLGYVCQELALDLETVISIMVQDNVNHGYDRAKRKVRALGLTETCRSYGRVFDVYKAKKFLRGRKPNFTLEIDSEVAEYIASCSLSIDVAYAMSRDLSIPLILVPARVRKGKKRVKCNLPIDGHHRMYKAYVIGRLSLPAYLLTEDEARSIRLDRRLKR